ncbi:MAG TPA: uridine diphosphate-N-acetylglucosamine-binding protein YvcK [Phycicoccus sp.]|mgnify:CR=1 FL=1|nr:uridine diphosphate-N-acetylglucosamine-binding protein YvcK [Phycicoccus sp.]HQY96530.1 uridine diphosphate-N-acetylglucosamine-binding protein YvcK [Phycicoccus sp.]HRA44133.1 uridine diphosphate-N-acetylglucosamine-binding protein YvcK [Phycicoccus sp.]
MAALGGGHGLAATLSALRFLTDEITAIVTVADNGGSSGRLREEFGVLPPGDLRMALAALCDESEWGHTWRDVLQHRFAGEGPLAGHALGNLLIVTLWELLDDPVSGLDLVGRLLRSSGRVLPMAAVPLDIEADVVGHDESDEAVLTITGQAEVATTTHRVREVRLVPSQPPAYPESVAAIRAADWVVLGPGSWFTSVMPHLLVPDVREALAVTRAKRVLVLNLEVGVKETVGFTPAEYLQSFRAYAPDVPLDVVLADPSIGSDEGLRAACEELGAELVIAPMAARDRPGAHDRLRLAAALQDVMAWHPGTNGVAG